MPITPTNAQYPAWEQQLLQCLGAPNSVNNLTALNLWAQSEGSVTNNALATSGRGVGASTCVAQCGSSSPIYEYDNVSDGVAQMCQFLKGSYYTGIVHALQQDAGLGAIFQAINASPWCKGCQNGNYPEALAAAAGGKGATISGGVGAGSSQGGGTSGGGGGGAATTGSGLSDCVVKLPLALIGGCIITKGEVKAITGAAAMALGLGLVAFGVMVMAAAAFDASGAKQAVTRVAGMIPGEGGMIARVAGGSSGGRTGGATRTRAPQGATGGASRRSSLGTGAHEPRISADIEREYAEAQRQSGPIGPRGGSQTSQRIAREQRRGVSVPGSGRPRTPEQRARARARARQPF